MDDMPSCLYYRDKPCKKPLQCPVHRELLRRPFKKTHLLRSELESHSWDKEGLRKYHRTKCGIFLYQYMPKIIPGTTMGEIMDNRRELEESGFRRPPIPTTDPLVSIYYQVGWEGREILAVKENHTCHSCRG